MQSRCATSARAASGRGVATRVGAALLAATLAVAGSGCATRAQNVRPHPTDPATYAGWSCDRLHDGIDQVQRQAADLAYAVDQRFAGNLFALGIGVTVFWPALFAGLRSDGPEAAELAQLKGRFEAMQTVVLQRGCGPAPSAMAAEAAASLPVAVGDRLVYDDRASTLAGRAPQTRTITLTVQSLRRDRVDYRVSSDGRALPNWQQGLDGNVIADAAVPWLSWRRLLRAPLSLGQLVSGELIPAGEVRGHGRVRGQVVAVGPQQIGGRTLDVAVIELFGDAPRSSDDAADGLNTRIDGVMAVERRSGMLVRLDLDCANPDYAARRRLVRVEAAGSAR